MDRELRILILEDSRADAELEEHELRKTGLVFTLKIVDTKDTFLKALDEFFPDLILSDYELTSFDGLAALRIVQEKCPDVPFILVTGKVGEEFIIDKLKDGATDYVLKGNLKRLVPAVNRALEEAKLRTERKQAEEFLKQSEGKYRQVVETATDIIFTTDTNGNFKFANIAGLRLTGYTLEELQKLNYLDLVVPEYRRRAQLHYMRQFLKNIPSTYYEYPFKIGTGNVVWFGQTSSLLIEQDTVTGFHLIAHDITGLKQMEEELKRLSVTDNLTQAYNRTKYEEVIKREIERTKRSNTPLSIAMFDIDHFKEVNDVYGHAVGDYVLKKLSQIAQRNVRDIDYLIRWGGEEFLVIGLDTNLRGAEMMAERIRHAIGNFSFDKVSRVAVSFGVTQFKQDDTKDSFMKRADDALYKAKEKGRNRVEVAV